MPSAGLRLLCALASRQYAMRASSGGPLSLVCGPAPKSTLGVSLLSSPSNNSRSQKRSSLAGNNIELKPKSDVARACGKEHFGRLLGDAQARTARCVGLSHAFYADTFSRRNPPGLARNSRPDRWADANKNPTRDVPKAETAPRSAGLLGRYAVELPRRLRR
jgi:hypothetical protein